MPVGLVEVGIESYRLDLFSRVQFENLDRIEKDACVEFNTRMLARRLNLSLFKIERKDAVGLMQWQQQNAIRLGILKQRTGGR